MFLISCMEYITLVEEVLCFRVNDWPHLSGYVMRFWIDFQGMHVSKLILFFLVHSSCITSNL